MASVSAYYISIIVTNYIYIQLACYMSFAYYIVYDLCIFHLCSCLSSVVADKLDNKQRCNHEIMSKDVYSNLQNIITISVLDKVTRPAMQMSNMFNLRFYASYPSQNA